MTTALSFRSYKLNTGHIQISYRNPINGKRKRNKFQSDKEAKVFKEVLERQYQSRNLAHFAETRVGFLVERHLKECPESKFMDRKNVFYSFCEEFNSVKLQDLTRAALRQWFAKIKLKHDYSERTLNSIRVQINHLFRFLVEEGLMSESPLDHIRFKRVVPPRRPRIVLSIDEVREILRNAETFSPDLLFIYLSCVAHTGARREEIVRLNREDIDFKTGLIHLKKTKNGRERFVRMSPILESLLRRHLENHTGEALLCIEDGQRLDATSQLARHIDKFKAFFPMDKADWGSHSLRHSFAYNFLMKGGKMYQLQAILGHRSIDVTVDLYGQLQAQDIACPSPYEP